MPRPVSLPEAADAELNAAARLVVDTPDATRSAGLAALARGLGMRGLEGFSASDYLSVPGGGPGAAAFSAVWYGILGSPRMDAGASLLGRRNQSSGWALNLGGRQFSGQANPVYLSAMVYDGSGNERTLTVELTPNGLIFSRPVHIAMVYAGTTLRLFLNGVLARAFPVSDIAAGITPAPVPMTIGLDPDAWNESAEHALVAGAGYVEAELSPAQLLAHFRACEDSGRAFVAGGVSWVHRYDASNPGDSAPATIEDLGSAGVDAQRVGTGLAFARRAL